MIVTNTDEGLANDWMPTQESPVLLLDAVVDQKLLDAQLGLVIEFTPEEAEQAGAFAEKAITVADALAAPVEMS